MPSEALIKYIRDLIGKGYSASFIKEYLLKNGYDARVIDNAIREVYYPPSIPSYVPKETLKLPIMIGSGVVIVLLAAIFFLIPSPEARLLDVSTQIINTDILPGDKITFNIEMFNIGSERRYDVTVVHEILDDIGKVYVTKRETVGIQTRVSKISDIKTPAGLRTGTYTLKSTATYDGRIAFASDTFNVIRQRSTVPIVLEPDEEEEITEERREVIEELPAGTYEELIGYINLVSSDDPQKALLICGTFDTNEADKCYNIVAKHQEIEACSYISTIENVDRCYMNNFVLIGDYTICDRLASNVLRQTCETYKSLTVR